jgi:hypothetical protein
MAQGAKPKPKRQPKPKLRDKAQFERVIEGARELGIGSDGDSFERAIARILAVRPSKVPRHE